MGSRKSCMKCVRQRQTVKRRELCLQPHTYWHKHWTQSWAVEVLTGTGVLRRETFPLIWKTSSSLSSASFTSNPLYFLSLCEFYPLFPQVCRSPSRWTTLCLTAGWPSRSRSPLTTCWASGPWLPGTGTRVAACSPTRWCLGFFWMCSDGIRPWLWMKPYWCIWLWIKTFSLRAC